MQTSNPLAAEFILFCHQRCQQAWPDLYDEMCWVAGHRLFRGMGYPELNEVGLSLGLANMDETIRMVEAATSESRGRGGKA